MTARGAHTRVGDIAPAGGGGPEDFVTQLFVDWRTAAGTTQAAITDGGKLVRWSGIPQGASIASAAGLGFPAGIANVFLTRTDAGYNVGFFGLDDVVPHLVSEGDQRIYRWIYQYINEEPIETDDNVHQINLMRGDINPGSAPTWPGISFPADYDFAWNTFHNAQSTCSPPAGHSWYDGTGSDWGMGTRSFGQIYYFVTRFTVTAINGANDVDVLVESRHYDLSWNLLSAGGSGSINCRGIRAVSGIALTHNGYSQQPPCGSSPEGGHPYTRMGGLGIFDPVSQPGGAGWWPDLRYPVLAEAA